MDTVHSADGTAIAVERQGSGPPLVLVHGATVDRTRWAALTPRLAPHRTVHTYDRRGRGASGDTAPYAVAREVEDLLAVLAATGGPTDLLGHSSGAILALQAAGRAPTLRRLALYEPPVYAGPVGLADRLRALLAAGDRAAVVRTFLAEGPRRPPPPPESPAWAALLALAPTMVYDARVQGEFARDPAALRALRIPALLLVGGASPPEMRTGIAALAAALPDARVVALPGQGHVAHVAAPDLLAREVLSFLTTPA